MLDVRSRDNKWASVWLRLRLFAERRRRAEQARAGQRAREREREARMHMHGPRIASAQAPSGEKGETERSNLRRPSDQVCVGQGWPAADRGSGLSLDLSKVVCTAQANCWLPGRCCGSSKFALRPAFLYRSDRPGDGSGAHVCLCTPDFVCLGAAVADSDCRRDCDPAPHCQPERGRLAPFRPDVRMPSELFAHLTGAGFLRAQITQSRR